MSRKLNNLQKNFQRIKIDDNSKLVIMSDCHRGTGNNYDNFLKNQNIFMAALLLYYNNGFTYIALGDSNDLWEVENVKDIIDEHINAFKLLKEFNDSNRLIMIY